MKSLIRSSMIQPEDELDVIYKAWIAHKTEDLPARYQQMLERMEYIDAKLRDGGKASMYKRLVEDVLQRFKSHGITRRTIDSDITRAKRFFLSVRTKEDKEYSRGTHIEWLKRFIWKAEKLEDMRAVAALMREKAEVEELKKQDQHLPDYEKYERQPILVLSDPAQINLPAIENEFEELQKLRLSRAEYMKLSAQDAEDIDFEEVEGEDTDDE